MLMIVGNLQPPKQAGRNNKNIPRKERRLQKIPTDVKREWDAWVNESVHTDRNNWWLGILAELQALSKAKQEAKVSELLMSISTKSFTPARQPSKVWTPADDPAKAADLKGDIVALAGQWAKKFTAEMTATPQQRDRMNNQKPLTQ